LKEGTKAERGRKRGRERKREKKRERAWLERILRNLANS
jgi:hypothetical protein